MSDLLLLAAFCASWLACFCAGFVVRGWVEQERELMRHVPDHPTLRPAPDVPRLYVVDGVGPTQLIDWEQENWAE